MCKTHRKMSTTYVLKNSSHFKVEGKAPKEDFEECDQQVSK